MKKAIYSFVIALVAIFMAGCGAAKLTPKQEELVNSNATLYTQVGMWEEKGKVWGTNYNRGIFIPVNSPVKIVKVSSRAIVFVYNDREIALINIPKHTQIDIGGLLERTFAKTKVDLSKFSQMERENIAIGKVVPGMSKNAVLVARGYPPAHETSLKSDSWKYWIHRFKSVVYHFKNGKVDTIKY